MYFGHMVPDQDDQWQEDARGKFYVTNVKTGDYSSLDNYYVRRWDDPNGDHTLTLIDSETWGCLFKAKMTGNGHTALLSTWNEEGIRVDPESKCLYVDGGAWPLHCQFIRI